MPNNSRECERLSLIAGVCFVAVEALPWMPLRLLFGLVLALVLPGRALLLCVMPERGPPLVEALLSVGLSMCITVLGGFVLHCLGVMTSLGWAIYLTSATLGLSWCAGRIAGAPQPRVSPARVLQRSGWRQFGGPERKMLAGAAVAVWAAFAVAQAGAVNIPFFRYTELWLVPDIEHPDASVNLGIRNMEGGEERFAIELRLGDEMVGNWSDIEIKPTETWTRQIGVSLDYQRGKRLEARLYKGDDRNHLYRQVWLSGQR